MKTITLLPAALGLALIGLATPSAHAQLLLTLTPAGQAGTQPGVFQFTGMLSNTSDTDVTLGGDTVAFNGPGGISAIDDSPFFNNAPTDLAPTGEDGDTYTGGFFNVTIPTGKPDGEYDGTFDITDDNGDTVGSSDFSVTVIGPAATPEPSAVAGLALGILGVSALAWRASKRRLV